MGKSTMSPDEAAEAARSWLSDHWHGTDDAAWHDALLSAGWAAPTWPADTYGRGLSREAARAAADEFRAAGAPGGFLDLASFHEHPWLHLLGNPLLAFGSAEIKEYFLPRLLNGEVSVGCLLYSEPGAGSDLAGVQTRAELDGDTYVVNGQKIWTTGGHQAKYGLLLARTDWDVPKHAGLSFFVIDMQQPGIEVRPIRQITGDTEFNEVFLTDARVPAAWMIGAPGQGWKALQIALAAERTGMGSMSSSMSGTAIKTGLRDAADDLVEAARRAGRLDDPQTRQEIVRIMSWRLTNAWTGRRAAAEIKRGPSSLASLGKLAMSRILHAGADFTYRMQGEESLVYDYDNPLACPVDRDLMFAFINSIGGGSDQIQRNIISERVLGLPKGYEPDKGVPFRDVRKGAATRSVSQA
ncbi:acyl-CoA dehydrogenase family protein [Streptomyces mexicanus]|uniref:Acyl-CoA dehydrogenase family protein n=1 Tax=Streptomyces mexicanus TaxID=178566 RepID=A0A7X1HXV9_9ACTN|nr:acyl-CoA dehydrogenase family protein [Streptomyces mexicanus]MBC2865036.1 acyl-CoA dehydrogenase family protein [Streptomyces mexicanus]